MIWMTYGHSILCRAFILYIWFIPPFDPLHLLFEAFAPDLLNLLNIIHDNYAWQYAICLERMPRGLRNIPWKIPCRSTIRVYSGEFHMKGVFLPCGQLHPWYNRVYCRMIPLLYRLHMNVLEFIENQSRCCFEGRFSNQSRSKTILASALSPFFPLV